MLKISNINIPNSTELIAVLSFWSTYQHLPLYCQSKHNWRHRNTSEFYCHTAFSFSAETSLLRILTN